MRSFIFIGIFIILFVNLPLFGVEENVLLIDDFNDKDIVNKLKKKTNIWISDSKDKSIRCKMDFDPQVKRGRKGYSLRIEYDIDSEKAFLLPTSSNYLRRNIVTACTYSTELSSDLQKYKYLTFYIKGDEKKGFPRNLPVEIKDSHETSRYIIEGITSKWKRFVIPLHAFRKILRWGAISELVFAFDDNLTRKTGAIYIDDIVFTVSSKAKICKDFISHQTNKEILIDGEQGDWKDTPLFTVLIPEEHLEYGKAENKKDLSCEIYSCWDTKQFYLLSVVKDNEIIAICRDEEIEQEDCFIIFFDMDNNGFVWESEDDLEVIFSPNGSSWILPLGSKPSLEEINYNVKQISNKYIVEVAVSWDFLKFKPERGKTFSISFAVQDKDLEDKTKKGRLNWVYKPASGKVNLGKLILQ